MGAPRAPQCPDKKMCLSRRGGAEDEGEERGCLLDIVCVHKAKRKQNRGCCRVGTQFSYLISQNQWTTHWKDALFFFCDSSMYASLFFSLYFHCFTAISTHSISFLCLKFQIVFLLKGFMDRSAKCHPSSCR